MIYCSLFVKNLHYVITVVKKKKKSYQMTVSCPYHEHTVVYLSSLITGHLGCFYFFPSNTQNLAEVLIISLR